MALILILFILMMLAIIQDALNTYQYEVVSFVKCITGYEPNFQMTAPVIRVNNVHISTLKQSITVTRDLFPSRITEQYIRRQMCDKFVDELAENGFIRYKAMDVPIYEYGIPSTQFFAYLDVIHPSNKPR